MEVELAATDLFEFVVRSKGKRCQVKGCSRKKKSGYRTCAGHVQKLWRARNPKRAAFHTLKDHAKGRKLEFAITFDHFCILAVATGYVEEKGLSPDSLSIDRIDARRGYLLDNIRVVTRRENVVKGNQERGSVFIDGVRIPWIEEDAAEADARDLAKRKGYVPFFQSEAYKNGLALLSEPEDETPHWLRDPVRAAA